MSRNDPKGVHVFLVRHSGGDPSKLVGSSALLAGLRSSLSGGWLF